MKVAISDSEDLKYLFAPVAVAQGKALRRSRTSELENLDRTRHTEVLNHNV
jgi:hypothetical protein